MPEEALQTGPLEVTGSLAWQPWSAPLRVLDDKPLRPQGSRYLDSPSPRVRRDLPMPIQGEPSGQYNVSCGGAHREPGTGDFVDADCRWTEWLLALMMRWPMRLCRQGYR